MANKNKKAAAKPKKLSAAERQKKIDALQDKRDGIVIASYERTLHALAGALGGSYETESQQLKSELAPIEADLAALETPSPVGKKA